MDRAISKVVLMGPVALCFLGVFLTLGALGYARAIAREGTCAQIPSVRKSGCPTESLTVAAVTTDVPLLACFPYKQHQQQRKPPTTTLPHPTCLPAAHTASSA